jgi:hypothetical protein
MIYESMIRVEQAGHKALKWGWARVDHHAVMARCVSTNNHCKGQRAAPRSPFVPTHEP